MVLALKQLWELPDAIESSVDRSGPLPFALAQTRLEANHLLAGIGQPFTELPEEAGLLRRHILGVGGERRNECQRQERCERSLS